MLLANSVMKTYFTSQVAAIVGVHKVTLQRWLLAGRIPEPKRVRMNGVEVRIWTNRDVERVRRYKERFYRKGRGRKKKSKE